MKDIVYALLAAWGQGWDFDTVAARGELLGRALWRVLPGRRDMACEAMGRLLGLAPEQARAAARASFGHNGRSSWKSCFPIAWTRASCASGCAIAGPGGLRGPAGPRGAVVATTGHLGPGNFWLGVPPAAAEREKQYRGPPPQGSGPARTDHPPALAASLEVLDHRNAAPRVLRCLHRSGTTAFLVDHNNRHLRGRVPAFPGPHRRREQGPALLALRAGALIQPLFPAA
jgi:KDO2-lipid IV(A) lauroyltransferase